MKATILRYPEVVYIKQGTEPAPVAGILLLFLFVVFDRYLDRIMLSFDRTAP